MSEQFPVVVALRGVKKIYEQGDLRVSALAGVDMDIHRGEFVALMGPSGSGKSTLLHIVAGIDRATSGTCTVAGVALDSLDESGMAAWRNRHIGFVFQSFNLIPVLTAAENIELPLLLMKLTAARRRDMVAAALDLVGLSDRGGHLPKQLSGGQEQRVAIARAIVTDPDILVADEPTGNLDAVSAKAVLDMLQLLSRTAGKTVVMVTHDPKAAAYASRVVHLEKGELLDRATDADGQGVAP